MILHLYNKKRILSVLCQRLIRCVLSYIFTVGFLLFLAPAGQSLTFILPNLTFNNLSKVNCDRTKIHKALQVKD